jgi:hypothetical protein
MIMRPATKVVLFELTGALALGGFLGTAYHLVLRDGRGSAWAAVALLTEAAVCGWARQYMMKRLAQEGK